MEPIMKKPQFLAVTLIAFALLAGCNSTKHNPALDDAHNNFRNAESNPNVTSMAALELKDASESLNRADQALSKGEDRATVDHLAYIANKKVVIAQETARRKAAEAAVANAGANRNQARLEARTAEADAAKQQVALMQEKSDMQTEELAAANANAASDQTIIARQEAQLKELNAKKTKRGLVITLGDVLFNTNKAQLKSGGMHNVQKLADFLKQYPQHKVLIEGYTDSTGSESYNQNLSERRADNVRKALVDVMGIGGNRVTTRGYGEDFPVASNDTAADRQLNRRVEIVISDENGAIAER
jgi:outer membrane protein OmpA-like peptidoglycan-associated protein